jgi:tetratricopeptide (TPR) repeat protein
MAFETADFAQAVAEHRSAQRVAPVVDTFRVGEADAAAYLGPEATEQALVSIERGLELEPDSYDLVLAEARALSLLGRDPQEIADAYERAVALYPLGLEVRRAAIPALVAAGRSESAETLQGELSRLEAAIRDRQGF